MHYLVTGGGGFIGSHLCDRLLADGHTVSVIDCFSTGFEEFLGDARASSRLTLVHADLLDPASWKGALRGVDLVFHLAANADVRFGLEHPRRDLEQNTIATFNLLEAMREAGVGAIAFTSTGSIYGEPQVFPTPEDAPFPRQTSLYGAAKLACEGLIQAYCEGYGMRGWIFRLVSCLGERYSHGHIFDFTRSLREDPTRLHVLGDGKQRKSYLYVGDCIEAMLVAIARADGRMNVFNLGTDEHSLVDDSVAWICQALGVEPELSYGGGLRGWIGDSPFIYLDCGRIRRLGWTPQVSIREGVLRTVEWLQKNPWVMEGRR